MANETYGVCMICGRAGKVYSCSLCGSLVCELHFDPVSGLCVNCKRGRRMGKL